MKKRYTSVIILIAILMFGAVLAGCSNPSGGGGGGDDNTDGNPFKGTWTSSEGDIVFIFTDTTFSITDNTDSSKGTSGTYTYSGNVANLTVGAAGKTPGNKHTLTIENNAFTWYIWTFTKK